jgi:hypothetical protein
MPALNLGSPAVPASNPSAGVFVIMNPFSGPKGSPFDAKQIDPTSKLLVAAPNNFSTGALNTGIGFGSPPIIGPTAPASIKAAGFNDDYTPGVTLPDGTAATDARLTCIGGGKSTATVNGIAPTVPYNAQPLLGFGNGGSRDAGAGPAFTGFGLKTVTATATIANGAAVEAGFLNRSGVSITNGQSVFGSSTAASAAVA